MRKQTAQTPMLHISYVIRLLLFVIIMLFTKSLIAQTPEINVKGGSPPVTFTDGQTKLSAAYSTDFGSIPISQQRTVQYTIENTGNGTLNISGISTAGDDSTFFTVSNVPSTVAPSGSATFNVTFTPTNTAVFLTSVHILSDDDDEGDFGFGIGGIGICLYPATIITGKATFCSGENTVLTSNALAVAGTIDDYKWYRDNALIANADDEDYSATQPGTYQVKVVDTYGCVTISNSFQVMTAPAIVISASPAAICRGQSSTLNVTTLVPTSKTYYISKSDLVNMEVQCIGPGRYTEGQQAGISWTDAGSGIVTSVQIQLSVGLNVIGPKPILTLLNSKSDGAVVITPYNIDCFAQSGLVNLNINPLSYQVGTTNTFLADRLPEKWGLVSDQNSLGGYYAKVIANYLSPAPLDYSWMPGGSTNQSPIVSPTSSTLYTVTAKGGGCTNTATQLVTVKSPPVVNATATPAVIGAGQNSTLGVSTNPPFSVDFLTRTYNIKVGDLVNMTEGCTGNTRYTTSGSGGFSWNDTASGIVTGIEIQLYIGINTNGISAITTALNGTNTGASLDAQYISCPFGSTLVTLNIDPAGYIVGGTNTFLATGLTRDWGLDINHAVLDGSYARVTVNYTSANTTFLWMPGHITTQNPVVSPASTTEYTVTATTTATGCSATAKQLVTVGDGLNVITLTCASINCNGGTTTLNVSANGGTGPYMYSLNGTEPYQSSNKFIVPAGTYTVTVKYADGSKKTTAGKTIGQPSVITATAIAGTISTSGATTTVTVTANGGTGTFKYSINGGAFQSSNKFIVKAGTYTIAVKDAHGCSKTIKPLTVAQPPVISISLSAGTIKCYGGPTTLTITASKGNPPYSYSMDAKTFKAGKTFTVEAGTYTVTVKDSHGHKNNKSITITQPPAIKVSVSGGTILCRGGTVSLTVSATGGTPAYNGTGTFSKGAGTYTFTVTDSKGCTGSKSITISQPSTLLALSLAQKTDVSCSNGSNGSIKVCASGGAGPYKYNLNSGSYGTSGTFPSLRSGTYTVNVKDQNGCVKSINVVIKNGTGSCSQSKVATTVKPVVNEDLLLKAKVLPNPTETEFILEVKGSSTEPLEIRVINMLGQPVHQARGSANQSYRFGQGFVAGVYIVEILQGRTVKNIKVVKN